MRGAEALSDRQAWRAMALLCCLFALSFLDRMVLALVVDPVRTSLNVTDNQISLLFGFGFVIVYVLSGFPAAHLVDSGRRKQILIGGVVLWSTATLLSGFATSYPMLAIFRSGVAIGEAVLMPAAMSLISDLFPREKRSLPTTIYTLTGVMMGAGSFIVGAGALKLAELLAPSLGFEPWRIMFVIVAVPGPVLAALVLWLVPGSPRKASAEGAATASFQDFAAHFRSNAGLYLPVFLGTGSIFTVALGMSAWGPTLLVREHGVAQASGGLFMGIFAIGGALTAMVIVTPLVKLLGPKSRVHGVLRTGVLLNLTALPILAVAIGLDDIRLVLTGVAVGTLGSIATATFTPLVLQSVTPTPLLGRMSAVYLMFNNLMGMGMGPVLVSALAARVDSERNIGTAMTIVAWSAIAVSLTCYLFALWRLRGRAPLAPGAAATPSTQAG